MQNRDQAASFPVPSLNSVCRPVQAGFRVVVRRRDGVKCLVSFAMYREDAVELAKCFRDAAIADQEDSPRRKKQKQHWQDSRSRKKHKRDGLAAVVVEKWVGTPTAGRWKCLFSEDGGFCYVFPKSGGNGHSSHKSGERVDCVLLPEKTRKGGWKAKLADRALAGPITNTVDVPKSAAAGQRVNLRVAAMSANGNRIQFHWLPDSDGALPEPSE